MLRLWRLVTIAFVALLMGLAFAHVLEKPAKMAYDGPLYVTLQRTLYVAWGPPNVGRILEPAAIIATAVLAIMVRKRRRSFALNVGATLALLLGFPLVFFWLVAPANDVFLSAAPESVPSNWRDLREQWEPGHTIRFGLQLFALCLVASSVLFERSPGKAAQKAVGA